MFARMNPIVDQDMISSSAYQIKEKKIKISYEKSGLFTLRIEDRSTQAELISFACYDSGSNYV